MLRAPDSLTTRYRCRFSNVGRDRAGNRGGEQVRSAWADHRAHGPAAEAQVVRCHRSDDMARSAGSPSSGKAKKPAAKRPVRRCGLCGKSGSLRRTECCDNWICDDEDSYRPLSFARNSCARNHGRFTLCSFHHNDGHEGRWEACAKCREQFETELYVYYGTNEYNFSKLPDPPAFEPTLCAKCGKRIVLGEGGYSRFQGQFFCMNCSPGFAAIRDYRRQDRSSR